MTGDTIKPYAQIHAEGEGRATKAIGLVGVERLEVDEIDP
jgi:hypothetical protein